jgi:hypothetical protein
MVSRSCRGTARAVATGMHRLACLAIFASSSALASPITVGASLGVTQDQASQTQSSNSLVSVFGRFGLTRRFAAELDLAKVDTAAMATDRRITGLAVLDLTDGGSRFVPQLFAGAGIDRQDASYGEIDGHHFEGGLGLEYRAVGGLVIGARFHLGGRSIDSPPPVMDIACTTVPCGSTGLHASEYRTLDAYAAVRF